MTMNLKCGGMLLAAVALAAAATSNAAAQNCGAGCGPRVGNSCVKRASDCNHSGLKQYPLSEKHYIKQFCGPHIVPGSCFGYFKPQITPWGQACPNYVGEPEIAHAYAPAITQPAVAPTPETPKTAPKVETPKVETPKADAPKVMPTIPTIPKVEEIPGKPPTTPILPGKLPAPAPVLPTIPKVEPSPIIPPAVQLPTELPNGTAGRF